MGRTQNLWMLKLVVHIVTTWLEKVQYCYISASACSWISKACRIIVCWCHLLCTYNFRLLTYVNWKTLGKMKIIYMAWFLTAVSQLLIAVLCKESVAAMLIAWMEDIVIIGFLNLFWRFRHTTWPLFVVQALRNRIYSTHKVWNSLPCWYRFVSRLTVARFE